MSEIQAFNMRILQFHMRKGLELFYSASKFILSHSKINNEPTDRVLWEKY